MTAGSPCIGWRDTGTDCANREQGLDTRNALDSFLAGIERRALRMAECALGNREDALDVVQEAMIRLCRKYAQRDPDEWRPLFYRILQNGIRDHYRRTAVRNRFRTWLRPRSGIEEAETGPVDGMQTVADSGQHQPDKLVAQADTLARPQSVLRQLPRRQREVFMLRVWDGMDVADTAQAMNCSQGSVKTHLSRALQRVREQLAGYTDHE
ncbi:MAG: RNA polymerase sigma factor [Gammaproteobacteria bacterium]|nr:RNA polymerase sigma factor [Gammaproteobacteria bacterium]